MDDKVINNANFEQQYNDLSDKEKLIVNNIISNFEDKSYQDKKKSFNKISTVITEYLNNIYQPVHFIKGNIKYNGLSKVNTPAEAKFNNRMHHCYKATKNIFTYDVWNKDQKNLDIINKIKNNCKEPKDKELMKELLLPNRKTFTNLNQAFKELSRRTNAVIKPTDGLNAKNVFIKHNDGSFFDVQQRKFCSLKEKEIQQKFKNDHIKNITIEDNVMTDKTKIEQMVPYKFYCANGKVFCCRIGFGYYDIEPFNDKKRRPEQYDEIWLNEKKEDFELALDGGKIKPEEQKKFNELTCDLPTYQKMWKMAAILSKNYPSMRVDLFCVKQPENEKNENDKDEKNKNNEVKYKIYFNELQRNSQGTWKCFHDSLKPEAFDKYNEMMHFRNIPDKNLTQAGKIIKQNDIKQYKKQMKHKKQAQAKIKPELVVNKIELQYKGIVEQPQTAIVCSNPKQQDNITKAETKGKIKRKKRRKINNKQLIYDNQKETIIKNKQKPINSQRVFSFFYPKPS